MLTAVTGSRAPAGRTSLSKAVAWIDGWAAPLPAEEVALGEALGRPPACDVVATLDIPARDRAAADGFALRAEATVGASAYNPLPFRLASPSAPMDPGSAIAVRSGDPLPAGADAVVRQELAAATAAGTIGVIAPVFAGSEIEPTGSHVACGGVLAAAGQALDPSDIGLLAAAGVGRIAVVSRPRIRCLLIAAGLAAARRPPSADETYDADGPLLASLVARDGGRMVDMRAIGRDRTALRAALAMPGADLILVVGGTGAGQDDHAAAILAEAGELALHGVALRPGDSAGAGRAAGGPVFLLPGPPAACLWAYELLAGRAVRRLAGRSPELPYPQQTLRAARKIVSDVGIVDVCPVQRTGDDVVPMPGFAEAGLAAAAYADGFVLVPEASEGYPQGAAVTVYLRRSPSPARMQPVRPP